MEHKGKVKATYQLKDKLTECLKVFRVSRVKATAFRVKVTKPS